MRRYALSWGIAVLLLFSGHCLAQKLTWQQEPLWGGSINAMLIRHDTLYIAGSGIYALDLADPAEHWRVLFHNDGTLANSIAVDMEGQFTSDYFNFQRFDHNGSPWNAQEWNYPPQRGQKRCVAFDSAGNIYVGSAQGPVAGLRGILFRSTDKGSTWQEKLTGGGYWEPTEVVSITVLPQGSIHAITSTGSVYSSIDSGKTWGWDFSKTNCVASDGLGNMYFGTRNEGIFRTINPSSYTVAAFNKGLIGKRAIYALHCLGGSAMVAGTDSGVYFSSSGGNLWTPRSQGIVFKTIRSFAFDSARHTLYCGSYHGGVYRSVDTGKTWEQFSRGLEPTVYRITSGKKGDLFATSGGVIYHASGAGSPWTIGNSGTLFSVTAAEILRGHPLDLFRGLAADKNDRWYYATAPMIPLPPDTQMQSKLFRSTDLGATWYEIPLPPPDTISSRGPYRYIDGLALTDSGNLYASDILYGIYMTADGGNNWSRSKRRDSVYYNSWIVAMGNVIFTNEYGIYRLKEDRWDLVMPDTTYDILVPAAGGKDAFFTGSARVYRTLDSGRSWHRGDAGLRKPDQSYPSIRSLAASRNGGHYVLASAYPSWLFFSSDTGRTWHEETFERSEGMNIYSVLIDTAGYGWAATSRGLFRTTRSVNAIDLAAGREQLPSSFSMKQNYPNPFNTVTTIRYTLTGAQFVSVRVYNTLGEMVRKLANEVQPPGEREIQFDGSNLPSGVYYVEITTGPDRAFRKVLLMK